MALAIGTALCYAFWLVCLYHVWTYFATRWRFLSTGRPKFPIGAKRRVRFVDDRPLIIDMTRFSDVYNWVRFSPRLETRINLDVGTVHS